MDYDQEVMAAVSPISIDAAPISDRSLVSLRQLQKDDPDLKFVLEVRETGQRPTADAVKSQSREAHQLVQLWDQLVISSGVLTHRFENKDGGSILYQWVVPKKQRKEILHHLHDGPLGAHLGENKTLEKLRERFYWPRHAADVKEWCSSCKLCGQRKMPNPKPRAPLVSVQAG